nr:hypothetical protein [Streptomyces sp. TLI_235]
MAELIGRSAREVALSRLGEVVPAAAAHLELAAVAAGTADAFRGAFLPQVVRNLSRARRHLQDARGVAAPARR